MDRDWIYLPRISVEYEKGVEEFIQFAQRYEGRSDDEVKFRCPCVNCLNARKLNATAIREHLICDGFLPSYTIWTWHGELIDFPTVSRTENFVDSIVEDQHEEDKLEDMIRDVIRARITSGWETVIVSLYEILICNFGLVYILI